nr:MAG TPA: hypothetical protein [Caudoviricetes sp.]
MEYTPTRRSKKIVSVIYVATTLERGSFYINLKTKSP